ncbi:tyrosine-type recombinase/integrase [Kitasatospora cineracea]|uniref:tyrosine-type recombinase/integrase n=1 Tax=Kitasatospora cineracea TaxID=88074 RepID=UPI0036AFD121
MRTPAPIPVPDRGRVYRRCGCRDTQRRRLGTRCPRLADPGHGSWAFAVDAPSVDGRRRTLRRSGFTDEVEARIALRKFNQALALGFVADPRQKTAEYLRWWLDEKNLHLKPTTMARYRDYVEQDLIPAFGDIPLDDLDRQHLRAYVTAQLKAGRGRVSVYRIMATLSSALSSAVDSDRLTRNAAKPPLLPRPASRPRHLWSEAQTIQFLQFTRATDPLYADLAELMITTGLRKGEALALHWDDVHQAEGVLFVRHTLAAVDNNQLVLTTPKTPHSKAWVALSHRAAAALDNRAGPGPFGNTSSSGYVFHRHGRPLHPKNVLDHFHLLCDKAGVPRTALHDLRHLAASFGLAAGVPLPIMSKTLRHRTLSTSANIYAELTPRAARAGADGIAWILDNADREELGTPVCRTRRPVRQHPRPHRPRPANRTPRLDDPTENWPMWPGHHHATTT